MKKLLTLIVLLVIFTSCTEKNYSEDPSLKESERIAILEKAKVDTTTTIIEMDSKFYFVKEKKVIKTSNKEILDLTGPFVITAVLAFVLIVILLAVASNEY